MKAQNFNYGDFKYNSILNAGENKKMLEFKIYKSFAKLQEIYIPELLFYGDLTSGMSFVMGMSMVSTTLSHHKIDKRQKKRVLRALDKIHDYKILHNDIREKNILVDEKGYVYLTDFGMSIRNDNEELF
ncbi:10478_t:CDS:2, partial [Funneliformis geosporum]